MSYRRGSRLAALACVSVALFMGACSPTSAAPSPSATAQSSTSERPVNQKKMADSLPDYIKYMLEGAETSRSDKSQIDILQRSLAQGSVSARDYETAWSNFKQCVVDKGNVEPLLIKYTNGMYHPSAVHADDPAKGEKFRADSADCQFKFAAYVDAVYAVQQDNPNLYEDPSVGIVDCLHRHNLVSKDYTANDFDREKNQNNWEFTFDRNNPDVRACMVANGLFGVDAQQDTFHDVG